MESLGAPGVGIAILLENLFPPIPSEVVLPLAGFTISQGNLGFWPTFIDRKSTRLNSSHVATSYAVFCLKKKSALLNQPVLQFYSVFLCYLERFRFVHIS